MIYSTQLESLSQTQDLANLITSAILPNFTIALKGDLGTGKTTLVRSILNSLGISGLIKSPTYNIVENYQLNLVNIYHFDLYRFTNPLEWYDLGFNEYFENKFLVFIEWPEKLPSDFAMVDWLLELKIVDEARIVTIKAQSDQGKICLQKLITSAVN
jgi:tRNA threonylcarbamoyladenosine biosynthesis protein TsaE